MRTGFAPNPTAIAVNAALALVLALPAAAQRPPYKAPRTADGKPNLNGIWQAMNTANWDLEGHAAGPAPLAAMGAIGAIPPGLGVVEGGEIPYLSAAAAKKKENFANRLKSDPEVKCFMPGVPRHLHALSLSNSAVAKGHPVRLRIRWRGTHCIYG